MDVTGGVASLNFDATELKGNLGSASNPNLQYRHLSLTIDLSNVWSLCMEFYVTWQLIAMCHKTPYLRTKLCFLLNL